MVRRPQMHTVASDYIIQMTLNKRYLLVFAHEEKKNSYKTLRYPNKRCNLQNVKCLRLLHSYAYTHTYKESFETQ